MDEITRCIACGKVRGRDLVNGDGVCVICKLMCDVDGKVRQKVRLAIIMNRDSGGCYPRLVEDEIDWEEN